MTDFDAIHLNNHTLSELSGVLLHLLKEREFCDTEIANKLLFNALDKVDEHMEMVDHMYQPLLVDKEQKTHNTAQSFLSGERELKRIIAKYRKTWCANKSRQLRVFDHARFISDTEELFAFILSRIQDETEHLYPLVREQAGDRSAA